MRIFTGKHPVELVVAAHQRPGPRLFHDRLKRRKVNFPQRPLAHVGRARHAPVFLVVGSIMLHARAHIPALHTAHLRRRQLSRQIRVLAEILKVPPAQRAALDVHRRPQKHRHILRAALLAQRPPHPFQQRLIEAGRRRACRREAHRLDAVVDAQMVRLLVLLAQPVRAVRHHHARDAQPFHALQMPEIRARTQPGLFLQRHLRHKLVYIAFQKKHILSFFGAAAARTHRFAVFSITRRQAGRQERPSVFEAFIAVFPVIRRSGGLLTSSSPGTSPPCLR